jgi:hypothetical protein
MPQLLVDVGVVNDFAGQLRHDREALACLIRIVDGAVHAVAKPNSRAR